MYNPEQVSQMLKIPPSTLRRYSVQYAAHLSDHVTKQRNRRYTEQDITTLARARELLSERKSPEQVNDLLFVISSEDKSPESTLELIPSISEALIEALNTARTLRVQVSDHDNRLRDTESKLSEMAAKLAQLESNQHLPWYRKLFKQSSDKSLPESPTNADLSQDG